MGNLLLIVGILLGGANIATTQNASVGYYNDAIQLAARVAADMNESADISANMTAELTVALEAIANSSSEAAELVNKKLHIHAFQYANTSSLQIYVDANAQWVQTLTKDKNSIEQTPLRDFALMHDLRLTEITNIDGIFMLSMQSNKPKNMKFIANEVSFVDDVIMVELPAQIGDGHDIKAKRINGGWMISYIYKYQDCISGCRKQCEWQFGVSNDSSVVFMGLYGEVPTDVLDNAMVVMQDND